MTLRGPTFRESRLIIRFDDQWRALAFDRTPWFRQLTGQGLKGVDLLGMKDGQLWLFEVKNYLPVDGVRTPEQPTREMLLEAVRQKGEDTRRLLRIIPPALSRHFLFRAWRFLVRWFPFLLRMEPEWAFWLDANRALEEGQCRMVLLLRGWTGTWAGTAPAGWEVLPDQSPLPPGMTVSGEDPQQSGE